MTHLVKHYGANFFLLLKANRCFLDLPHLSRITIESNWRFSIQYLGTLVFCAWSHHTQSTLSVTVECGHCLTAGSSDSHRCLCRVDLLYRAPRAPVSHYVNAVTSALSCCLLLECDYKQVPVMNCFVFWEDQHLKMVTSTIILMQDFFCCYYSAVKAYYYKFVLTKFSYF